MTQRSHRLTYWCVNWSQFSDRSTYLKDCSTYLKDCLTYLKDCLT
ncbi:MULTISPECIES: hypothetical protein [Cyanophyceae]|nr:hypothetical protein [Phormidium sp. FACHB-592]